MKKVLILHLIFYLNFAGYSQGWEVFDSGTDLNLIDVFFIDSTNGWIVGDSALILRYGNGSWEKIEHDICNDKLNAIHFIDSANGWFIGDNGTILKYTNGDISLYESPTTVDLNDIELVDEHHGWIVCDSLTILELVSDRWEVKKIDFPHYSIDLIDIEIYDSAHAVILGNRDKYWYFHNNNWVEAYIDPTASLGSCSFIDSTSYILSYSGQFPMAEGGGVYSSIRLVNYNNFYQGEGLYFDSKSKNFKSIYLFPDTTGWLITKTSVDDNEGIYYYTNGKLTKNKSVVVELNSIMFVHKTFGWIVGDNCMIYRYNPDIINNIKYIRSDDSVTVYPNPFKNEIFVKLDKQYETQVKIKIYNITGNLVYREEATALSNRLELNVELQPGVYFFNISDHSLNKTIKILKR